MKRSFGFFLPPALVLAGLTVCCLLLWSQTVRFRRSVERIAEDVRVSLIDMNGKVVYDSTGRDLPNHSDRAEFEAVRADGMARSVVREAEHDLQQKLLDEMRKLETFRRDFIANVSHEIKTPVTGILGAVEILADESSALDAQDRNELQKVLRDQSMRLNALVEDILSLSRLEKAGIQLLFSESNNKTIEQSNNSLIRPCDSRLIESAVSNLIQNALRYSGSKDVEVKLEREFDGKAVISVCDHGIGIQEDCQGRIFERFYRVDKNRSRALGGTGLGLAIVKHIAQLHGGEVSVRSTPGEGSVFTLSI